MATQNEAKSTGGTIQNPGDCKTKGKCPCDAFDRCRKRRPYGSDVWGKKEKKKKALGAIAFNGTEGIKDADQLKKLQTRFMYRNKAIIKYNSTHEKKWRFNKYFANLRAAGKKSPNVLYLPPTSDPYITKQMNKLKPSLDNTGLFTDFQRSMVARANLVRNGLTLRSDTYRTQKGEKNFNPRNLIPYSRDKKGEMWSVDHIQIRAKGGCNRFCNAAVLKFRFNGMRGDNGPSCPCIIAEKGNTLDLQEFGPHPEDGTYHLYVCVTYTRNQKEGEPPKKLPGICHAKKRCKLDDPRKCKEVLSHGVIRPIYKT